MMRLGRSLALPTPGPGRVRLPLDRAPSGTKLAIQSRPLYAPFVGVTDIPVCHCMDQGAEQAPPLRYQMRVVTSRAACVAVLNCGKLVVRVNIFSTDVVDRDYVWEGLRWNARTTR